MPKVPNVALQKFNVGVISSLALARTDVDRLQLSASTQTNWMPRVLGSMMLRPGWEYITSTLDDAKAKYLPFVFSTTDLALIELTDSALRVLVDDEPISRPSVSTAVTNGTFDTDLSGWTDADESGATSFWTAGASQGLMDLIGTGFNAAIRRQEVTVSGANQNVEHALRVVVDRGPVLLRVGSSSGGDQYIAETALDTGTHSLAFTPTGNFHIQLFSRAKTPILIDSITVESSGIMDLPTIWEEANLPYIRFDQSGDILFIACDGLQQQKIERRATRSWSVVDYVTNDGPFRVINTSPVRLTPSALSGGITLTASSALFKSTNVGSLYRLESTGQKVQESFTGEDQFTDEIRVTGIGASREFTIAISNTFVGTLTLQRSPAEPGAWTDVTTYTGPITTGYNDALDNQIIYYRIGIKAGNYTSGTADASLTYSGGSRTGVVRITGYTSETSVTADVLEELGGTSATVDWYEGAWSDRRGWPSSVAFYEGRLWWAGKDKMWGSVSDGFYSFDDSVEGDSAPISRSIGSGPVDSINWLLPLQRLFMGTGGSEKAAKSSSIDEPLTTTNFNLKNTSTQGSAPVSALMADDRGIFVQKSSQRVFQILVSPDTYDYTANDLTLLVPEIGKPSVVTIAIQRQPDTRVHCVRSDGKVAALVFDPVEKIQAWILIETDGFVEDVVVLPGIEEDQVYYVIRRTIDGDTVRFLEKWALESECEGNPVGRSADAHVMYEGAETTTITGLDHLEGEEVVVWGWNTVTPFEDEDGNPIGRDLGAFTVTGGQITGLDDAVTNACVGLYYRARYKSVKLAFGAVGTALIQPKRVDHLGVIAQNLHPLGLRYGPSFDRLDDLPLIYQGAEVDVNGMYAVFDEMSFAFDGEWNTDSRVCLEAAAPRPCTLLALIVSMALHEKS